GDGCDGRDRDRGAESHHEGRRDPGPEYALRQREDQHQDRAGTRPQADREDRRQSALPAAGAGELVGGRPMRMTRMIVVIVRVIMIMMRMVMIVPMIV